MVSNSNTDSGPILSKPTAFAQKNLRPLTRKQQVFVNHILENPKDSYTKAAQKAYNTNNARTASVVAAENLAKPSIIMALGKANDRVEQVLTRVIDDWGDSEDTKERGLALDTAKYIHDKIHGKATQKIQSTTSVVTLSVDLSGGSAGEVPPELISRLNS